MNVPKTSRLKIHGPTTKCWRERRNLPSHDSLLLSETKTCYTLGNKARNPEASTRRLLRNDEHPRECRLAGVVAWDHSGHSNGRAKLSLICEKSLPQGTHKTNERLELNFHIDLGPELPPNSSSTKAKPISWLSIYTAVEVRLVSKDVNTAETITKLKKIFSRYGITDILFMAPVDSNEFNWGFENITSAPGYLQSNGEVERAVRIMPMILKNGADKIA